MTSSIGSCGSTSSIQIQTAAQLSSQSGKLIANAGGVSYIATAGKTYEIVAGSASVKKDLETASRFNGSMFATVKGSVQMKGGREVFVAKSIVGEKPMQVEDGKIVGGSRCGPELLLNTGSETVKLEPMTESLKSDFGNFRGGVPAGTKFVGVRKGNTLQVWDVQMRSIQPMPPSRRPAVVADSFR